ncbi:5-methyltetrahydropteroyltriglutamate--homocysteine S-methyltransferase [Xylanimonas cellulosilytica DSM 15894]|uniref:5-methyltetrahydropteroyltriglutamate--homocysteine S-methyltransferase n=1 Tax=Xylanimonas cellulosilytica (strain DSM 15894 / JCM 12276 / CECT 5975 / KCTC 9989 / LMG 20990 / NBRC 107835 / XIL07) TaxID=446471 RepID=D1BT18_XYLCX|nr:5-methyltetrahydropteroyltriglutamate--homocysteine S-methyltransferase [Xylanimonas cellulosilytica]ACZ30860.1 5-methyltetrahydropteroyltriglutamate--homocysteine S-methyltransferase [Xylanimonas cellulosilytica DSM 15894]
MPSTPAFPGGTILGYPRIGRRRELKRALEAHWSGRTSAAELAETLAALRLATARHLVALGLDAGDGSVPGSFSPYDHVLDAAVLLGIEPADRYFAAARGDATRPPLEMTKWFDTNYHYLVPEIGPGTPVSFADDAPVRWFTEAAQPADGGAPVVTRPVVVGPVTFLLLATAAPGAPEGFRPLDRLDDVVTAYGELLAALGAAGAPWVQLDEPALVADTATAGLAPGELAAAVERAYGSLTAVAGRPQILVAAPYGDLRTGDDDLLAVLAASDVEAIAVDLVRGEAPSRPVPGLATTTLVAGLIDGHNIWRADLAAHLDQAAALAATTGAGAVTVGTSTSLLHVPHDVDDETWDGTDGRDPRLAAWLAFADQKVTEVVTLANGLRHGADAVGAQLAAASAALADRAAAAGVVVPAVRDRAAALGDDDATRAPYAERAAAQADRLRLPALPTTTIGSFPQTPQIRAARNAWARGAATDAEYRTAMRDEIAAVITLQEELGLDVLVHGEPERNDMVQYFAEQLDGFAVTAGGWVQSYGSRCVRPPILWGDVSRPAPMTVEWTSYAQSLTTRPVKGMLTGPVTILAWSFVRDDLPLADVAAQVALALRDEVGDLTAAGTAVVQVDEPALRELLPLRRADQPAYLAWSVRAFRVATGGAGPDVQVHTHLCYSDFGEVIDAIDGLDADVTSLEAARSRMEIVPELHEAGYARGIGPGVWDIHSPRVPTTAEVTEQLTLAVRAVDPALVWANPDCGLKTRGYEETTASLRNLVAAAHAVRATL